MMTCDDNRKLDRREFLRRLAAAVIIAITFTAGLGTNPIYAAKEALSAAAKKKVIVIGFDGMDPRLCEKMMNAGDLPNLAGLREQGGYKPLATSNPPQSPVAWATFITGAGPGHHGIFDFIHRHPEKQCAPFYSAAETILGEGYWEVGDHRIQLNFWPFNHTPTTTLLRREGTPFWDYLDEAGISSAFYDLPANYPPSPSKHHHHCCLAGMGTPDLLGGYGTYQHFAEDGPIRTKDEGGGKRSMLFFEDEAAQAKLIGPPNTFLKEPEPTTVDFVVYRDIEAGAAVIEIQKHKVVLKEGQWSPWLQLDFKMLPALFPNDRVSGICRFYLQEIEPNFRLYVTPINADPIDPAIQITEPPKFIEEISDDLGLFYTTGFQEDHKALSNKVFTDAEFVHQASIVLQERLNLLQYALENYDEGLLFFYFSSTDLQAHMFWWDSDEKHQVRSIADTKNYFGHLQDIYRKMDSVVGEILKRYSDKATVIVMSDHGFANFKRQFNVNSWLRENGYIQPSDCSSILSGKIDWSQTKAYGLGLNGLYLNLKGREKYGIVEPGQQREELLNELVSKLKAVRDIGGSPVIRNVYRTDQVYSGPETYLAPDLLVGYYRGYRASWATTLGEITEKVLSENDSAWSADHCIDPLEVPGVVFSNEPIRAGQPALIDIAPTILKEFGLKIPSSMEGKSIF